MTSITVCNGIHLSLAKWLIVSDDLVFRALEERIALIVSRLRQSPELKEKLLSAQSVDEAINLANEDGLDLDLDSILKLRSYMVAELSDQELEGIAAGFGPTKLGPNCY